MFRSVYDGLLETGKQAMAMATDAMKQMATQMTAMHGVNAHQASQASVAPSLPEIPTYTPMYIQGPLGFAGPPPSAAYALQDSGQYMKTKMVGSSALMLETKRECPKCKNIVFHFGQDCHTLWTNGYKKKKKFDEDIKKYSKKH